MTPYTHDPVHLAVTHQHCPRRRVLEFHLLGTGIEAEVLDVAHTTRSLVKQGMSLLLAGDDPKTAIRIILSRLSDLYSGRGTNAEGDPYTVFSEQSALLEAVLSGYAAGPLQTLRQSWTVLDADILLSQEGQVYSLVLRPVAAADRDALVRDLHSLYTVTRGAQDKAKHGEKYGGLFVQYVQLGERLIRSGEKLRTQRTPFITGYRQKIGGRMSARRERTDPRTGHTIRLGNDYKLFRVWESRSPVTLEAWVRMLQTWGELDRLFPSVLINPPQPAESREAWAVVEHLNALAVPSHVTATVLERFPMYRHSCDFPNVCPYQQMECCYGDIPLLDPTEGGIYRRKETLNGNR